MAAGGFRGDLYTKNSYKMETLTNRFIGKVVSGLRAAASELEELQVQLALGKAEAGDKYEETKKKLSAFIQRTKSGLTGSEDARHLKALFEELLVQLALGKAETRDAFKAQKGKITKAVREVERFLANSHMAEEIKLKVANELRVFRIKLDILRLRFMLGKLNVRKMLRGQKTAFEDRIQRINDKLYDTEMDVKDRWAHFTREIERVFTHLRRAFAM
jgi:hypothetical protein